MFLSKNIRYRYNFYQIIKNLRINKKQYIKLN